MRENGIRKGAQMDLAEVLENIAKKVPTDDDVYIGEDGLEYCKKCNTARQCKVELFSEIKTMPCLCKCMSEAREKEDRERKRRERMEQAKRYRSMGFADRDMQHHTFASDDNANSKIARAMRTYVERFKEFRKDGKGLLLYGPVGTGKSFYAACICNALIDKGYPCLLTNFSRLINTISAMWEGKQEYIDSLSKFALVAIDDLGVERDTEFMNESVTTIIDSLYRANVPMIITSNYTPRQLTDESDIRRRRVYDRLLERCVPIEVKGESRRKEKGRKDYKDMMKALGLQ